MRLNVNSWDNYHSLSSQFLPFYVVQHGDGNGLLIT
jgi:hypothetical protein